MTALTWLGNAVLPEPPKELLGPLGVPEKTLMAPGPSNASNRVRHALQHPLLGHLHPEMCQLMDEVKAGIQYAFQTKNRLTLAISASGHGGMEACLGNILELGETVLIARCGLWGERAANMAIRIGAHVEFLDTKPGVAFTLEQLEAAVKRHRPAVVFVVHAESSTGMKQSLPGVGDIVHRYGGLLIVDTVASIGGESFYADAWGVDAVYTGSQKVLGAPPGITPVTFSPAAEKKIFERKTQVPVYYWDMTILGDYWSCFGKSTRIYHHTISATLIYGLREALAQLAEERLPNSWARHAAAAARLEKRLAARGLEFFISNPENRLRTIVSVKVPPGVDWKLVTQRAMKKYKVEIGGGLGPTVGKIFRIGLMGVNADTEHVDRVWEAFDDGLKYARTAKL
ncbi:alanine--glyoxylate aminotransferase [Diprion similis]|uniref:alanine--glyoxylate aminotransferase n=1 Tax=Diprion similis TaxID=362088 RepID=UPI001EF8AC2D|nr:alanine--glyoxylate aminotransferase [Diprion similis]XP_046744643.1 alanine--glyoxylate aminotransferase [Diprion similis]XP_046744644.1 alanine--glyoxylate aminotransferase [Diprion similis]